MIPLSIPSQLATPPKTNMDTQNDGLEKVTPTLNMAIFWYQFVSFLGCIFFFTGPPRKTNHPQAASVSLDFAGLATLEYEVCRSTFLLVFQLY